MGKQASQTAPGDADKFSLMFGGPLYQLFRRASPSRDSLEFRHRIIGVIVLVAWLPLLILSLLDGVAAGNAVNVPFLFDVDAQVQFLLSLPVLLACETMVNQRTREVVAQFVSRGIVPEAVRPRFIQALESATKLRNSIVAELLIIAFVYVVGIFVVWRYFMVLDIPTWYGTPDADRVRPKLAGWWYILVSLPIYQFILLRWYYRILIWTRMLWQVSRLPLAYSPLHPDGTGGIGFLSGIAPTFAPLLFAQGAVAAGTMANTILFQGQVLTSYYLEIVALVAVTVFVVVVPMLVFVFPLSAAKRNALREYGHLSQRYVDEFADKWMRGARPNEALVGNADIQSLADLGNSFDKVRNMSIVPVTRGSVAQLVIAVLLPMMPLLLTLISFEDLLKRLVMILM